MKIFEKIMAVCALVLALLAAQGCGNGEKKAEMGPEEAAEAFLRAVAAGDFETAAALCDVSTMNEYIEGCAQAWSMLQDEDGNTYEIATGMLKDAEFTVEDTIKEGDRRHMIFRLSFNGEEKKKLVIMRKEEGAWKVETITDRP